MITIMIISTMTIPPIAPITPVLLLLPSLSVESPEVLGEFKVVETERVLETCERVLEGSEVLVVALEDVKVVALEVIEV